MNQNNEIIMHNNINLMKNYSNVHLINNNIKDQYLSLLKKNYMTMSAYKIFYLYSLFNEGKDFYRLKYAFKKWKKTKKK